MDLRNGDNEGAAGAREYYFASCAQLREQHEALQVGSTEWLCLGHFKDHCAGVVQGIAEKTISSNHRDRLCEVRVFLSLE